MLDVFMIFSKSGLVLFKYELATLKGDPVDALIRTVLLENRSTTDTVFKVGSYAIKWKLVNKYGIVCVAVYQSSLALTYVDDLLENVATAFPRAFKDDIADATGPLDFGTKFDTLLFEAEENSRRSNRQNRAKKPAAVKTSGQTPENDNTDDNDTGDEADDDEFAQFRSTRRGGPRGYQGRKSGSRSPKSGGKGSGNATKAKRAWNEKEDMTEEERIALDVTGSNGASADEVEAAYLRKAKVYLPDEEGEMADLDKEAAEEDGNDDDDDDGGWNFGSSAVGNFFQRLTGQKPLTREDLSLPIETMQKQLQAQNVSAVAAREICEAVMQDLEGQKLGSMTRGVSTAVRESCEKALQRLLAPKRSIDVLREARAAKAEGRPYTIVFIGVNGVGKSTSLSKVCYYLKNNGLKVMLCACDTFRSGAIEQLKVHSKNLGVPVFEAGYNKDAASVAVNGIKQAKDTGMDVVLIDTAGRMQNNEPLMRSLTKLVAKTKPDLCVQVVEALAGNDATDQLVHFDKALKDFSETTVPRTIDGMIMTKFDTIGDKVGGAISLVHATGQPIIFVGTGQKYTNINKLNAKKIVRVLLQ
ncbi:Signal recognition particle receptor subunit alpha [Hondaea fermentalgiana]|uniref:Signal recognition particle receptor subunit alpha n=1 Tax=Hondaea fermentalgiana TaxID=2315210 RepID=A0A2R5G613_9STRA|nr:Signal recognition particle receptor subunit alpha [Hondaea fermentalgiana]|eukprot:GBG26430.1 Signal recognition particle receptor subunit alpha [Hondaea fermentalgiana]